MKPVELVVLLPCHGLEDFPLDHAGDEADSLLAAWSALWHPSLMAAAGGTPRWYRVDTPPNDVRGRLIVMPSVGQDRLPAGFATRCRTDGGVLLRKFKGRAELVAAALAVLAEPSASELVAGNKAASEPAAGGGAEAVPESGVLPKPVDAELAADFLALGYCRLQVEMISRHMHYSSNLDEVFFDQQALAGAVAAAAGDEAAARDHLANCFSCLYEARKQFYPVDAYLVDLILVADTTLGESLRRELAGSQASNLLATGEVIEQLAREQPATLSALSAALERGTTSLIGGDSDQRELPLLPVESLLAEIESGLARYQAAVGRRPTIYGRRRYGLSPTLPQMLSKLDFRGAVHCTLDDGRFPLGSQCKTRWEGLDGTLIDAYAQVPCDATQPATFLQFARKMGESMETDHVATLAFVHWPGTTSYWYDDLKRIARYSPVLGKFARLDDYFSETAIPPVYSRFTPDEYRSPYLMQAVIRRQADPISRFVREHREQATKAAVNSLRLLTRLVADPAVEATSGLAPAAAAADPAGTANAASRAGLPQGTDDVTTELTTAVRDFSAALPRKSEAAAPGLLVVNPLSFGRHATVTWPADGGLPLTAAPVRAAGVTGDAASAIIDLPAMGFTRIELGRQPEPPPKRAKPLAENNVLNGEHFTVTVSPNTGGIQSIHDFQKRANRLSQRLALRTPGEPLAPGDLWRDPDESAIYTAMVADSLEVTSAGPALGEIVTTGGLVDAEGKRLATFKQRAQLWQGSRILWLHIEVEPHETLRADPWNSYIAARFAWNDPAATLHRGVHLSRQETSARRLEAPEYVEISDSGGTTTLLTGGHPYHRRVGDRTLDSLLIVRGETARQFVLGVGVDVSHPHTAAIELLAPPVMLHELDRPPAAAGAGWLFHLDTRTVVATHWEALDAPPSEAAEVPPPGGRRPRGFRVRLLDAAGRSGRVLLRTPWPVSFARRTNFLGETVAELALEDDKIAVDFSAHEWIQVEAWWTS